MDGPKIGEKKCIICLTVWNRKNLTWLIWPFHDERMAALFVYVTFASLSMERASCLELSQVHWKTEHKSEREIEQYARKPLFFYLPHFPLSLVFEKKHPPRLEHQTALPVSIHQTVDVTSSARTFDSLFF